MNITIITGRLTATPELKFTQNEKAVTTFTLANDTGWGDNKKTNFLNCVAWNKNAETICKFFEKGDPILINGQVLTRNYEAKDGSKRTATEILVDSFDFLISKKSKTTDDNTAANNNAPAFTNANYVELEDDSDLPF